MTINRHNLGNDLLQDADGDLVVGPDGDIALTDDGLTTLVQDLENGLRTLPGELFGHDTEGAGVRRLIGEDDEGELSIRSISDFMTYGKWVAPRIRQETLEIKRLTAQESAHELRVRISFIPLLSGVTNRLNLVWNANTTSLEVA
jgi:hypothetical protein